MSHINRGRITIDHITPTLLSLYWGAAPIPQNFEVLGMIKRGDNISHDGVLMRNTVTGMYVQGNYGGFKAIDGRKVAAALGTIGRPKTLDKARPVLVNLDEITVAALKKHGNGNLSAGIRLAALALTNQPNDVLKTSS